jgi:peptide/nickel transport system substrate-binding protein
MRRTAASPARRSRLLPALGAALACAGLVGAQSAAASTAPSAPAGDPDASVVVGLVLEPDNLDILHTAGAAIDQALLDNVYETLVTASPSAEISPGLATLDISDDGLTYTLTLQDGVTFSDGKPLSSADVVWTLEQARYPGPDASAPAGSDAAAATDPDAPTAPGTSAGTLAAVDTIDAPDDSTVVLHLSQPDSDLAFKLSRRAGAVLEEGATDLETTAVGTGPFTLEDWSQGSSITLARNDTYWGEPAGVAEVVFQYFTDPNAAVSALQDGDADVLTAVGTELVGQFENDPDYTVTTGTTNGEFTLGFNNQGEALSDQRVRQAITQAIDKEAILQLYNGYGTIIGAPVPPTDPWYEDLTGLYPFDPDAARALLADAGYGDGLDLTYVVPSIYPSNVNDYIVAALGDVGIDVEVQSVEFPTWIEQVYTNHDYDMTAVLHVEAHDLANYANPDYYWLYDSPDVQDLIGQAKTSTDPDQTIELYREAAHQIAVDAPADWLILYDDIIVARAGVTG